MKLVEKAFLFILILFLLLLLGCFGYKLMATNSEYNAAACDYTGARKAPIRRTGNRQSGNWKSLLIHCGGAASPVWREPPFRTNGAA